MPRKASSLDEQMLLEACRFGGNDEAVADMLKKFHFEPSVLQQALVMLQGGQTQSLDDMAEKTIRRIARKIGKFASEK